MDPELVDTALSYGWLVNHEKPVDRNVYVCGDYCICTDQHKSLCDFLRKKFAAPPEITKCP
ncbi:MAG: hypothetical protein JWM92_403 [Candidatus Nomurabacteria bacterium]|nr:hypothetical protein [Candidatus Nomurabacteria bacterium]